MSEDSLVPFYVKVENTRFCKINIEEGWCRQVIGSSTVTTYTTISTFVSFTLIVSKTRFPLSIKTCHKT